MQLHVVVVSDKERDIVRSGLQGDGGQLPVYALDNLWFKEQGAVGGDSLDCINHA